MGCDRWPKNVPSRMACQPKKGKGMATSKYRGCATLTSYPSGEQIAPLTVRADLARGPVDLRSTPNYPSVIGKRPPWFPSETPRSTAMGGSGPDLSATESNELSASGQSCWPPVGRSWWPPTVIDLGSGPHGQAVRGPQLRVTLTLGGLGRVGVFPVRRSGLPTARL